VPALLGLCFRFIRPESPEIQPAIQPEIQGVAPDETLALPIR
jgi:hypothetical protein